MYVNVKVWRNFVENVGQNLHMKGQNIVTTVANRRSQVKTIFIFKIRFREITEFIYRFYKRYYVLA